MLGLCLRYTKSMQEAEDVLQDGFIKVLRHIGSYKAEGSLEGWIRKIMVNTALNQYRSNLRFKYHEDIAESQVSSSGSDDLYSQFALDDLLKVIQTLPDGYRMVFNLFEIEGYSHKEIADMLHVSESTSKTQLLKARMILRKKLSTLSESMNLKIEK